MNSEATSRFVNREMTVAEMILLNKYSRGNFEAGVRLVEARLADPISDLRTWPMSEYRLLRKELFESLQGAEKVTAEFARVLEE